ncbi:MAG: hypothetical protein KatS3mg087_2124 [Patescibacteria group bacterium]|nr:MAG: hypothetical protein KatS3mg087_2124 [Patescibacteria group bacterium]
MINNKYTNEQRIRVMAKNKSELKSKNRRAGAAVEATPARAMWLWRLGLALELVFKGLDS